MAEPPDRPDHRLLNHRICILMASAFLLTVLVILRLCWLVASQSDRRQTLLDHAESQKSLAVPGRRGAIYDHEGHLLAQSLRIIDVVWNVPSDPLLAAEQWQAIQHSQLPVPLLPSDSDITALYGTSQRLFIQEDIIQSELLQPLAPLMTFLDISVSYKRIVPPSDWSDAVGNTTVEAQTGLEIGTSGLEKQFDRQLKARRAILYFLPDGKRLFMDNRNMDGHDVFLPPDFSLPGDVNASEITP